MKSLYSNPQKKASRPINKIKYLKSSNPLGTKFLRVELNKHKTVPTINRVAPWPISPNMIPNSNGNETTVKTAGFTSLYEGTP